MKSFARLMLLGIALSALLWPSFSAHADDLASGARIHRKFKLLPGKADNRYVVYFPFEVAQPGRVRIYHEMTAVDLKVGKTGWLPHYILADARVFDKYG